MKRRTITNLIGFCMLVFLSSQAYPETQNKFQVSFEEKLLATIPKGLGPPFSHNNFDSQGRQLGVDLFISPSLDQVAYPAQYLNQGGEFMVVGDKKGKEFISVGTPVFSPDGQKVAYVSIRGYANWFVIIGDKMGERSLVSGKTLGLIGKMMK